MEKKWDLLKNELGDARLKLGEGLRYHTGRNLDCLAEAFYIATNQKELQIVLNLTYELNIPFKLLGYDTIEPPKTGKTIESLVIKNRTHLIKISGIKGKFVIGSMGIDQVLLEVDSGVSLVELKDYLVKGKLAQPILIADEKMMFGEVLPTEFGVQGMIETIKVWEKGMVYEVSILEFNPTKQIVLSAVLRVKSNQI